MKLNYDKLLSNSAFNCNLRHYNADAPKPNQFWWPQLLDLAPLRRAGAAAASNPLHVAGAEPFDYATAFEAVDLTELKADLTALMRTSQEWWPADYGHYGPFFIRMAWHAAAGPGR